MQEAGVRDALSKVALILSSSGQEEELLRRVGWVETVWDLATESLTARLSQLQFENQQQVRAPTSNCAVIVGLVAADKLFCVYGHTYMHIWHVLLSRL